MAGPIINTTCTTSSMLFKAGNMPAVSFLKAIAAQDGHAGYSDPLLEQDFSGKDGQRGHAVAILEKHCDYRHVR